MVSDYPGKLPGILVVTFREVVEKGDERLTAAASEMAAMGYDHVSCEQDFDNLRYLLKGVPRQTA